MTMLLDLCVAIFLLFQVLFAMRLKPLEYLQTLIVYLLPLVIIYFTMPSLYASLMTNFELPKKFDTAFSTNAHLMVYLAIELAMLIVLVIILKVICYYTIGRILEKNQVKKVSFWKRLINVPLALAFGFIWSFVLVLVLTRLGITYQKTISQTIYDKTAFLSEMGMLNQYQQKFQVFESASELENRLLGKGIKTLDEKMENYQTEMLSLYQELKAKLASLSPLTGSSDIENIYLITNGEISLRQDANYKDFEDILDDLGLYKELSKAFHETNSTSGLIVVSYLIENNIQVSNRTLNRELTELKTTLNNELTLMAMAKNFLDLPANADAGSYKHYMEELLFQQKYQLLLANYVQEYPDLTPNVKSQFITIFANHQFENITSGLTLREQYFKDELFDQILETLKSGKKQGLLYPLIDDLVENEDNLALIVKLIKAEYPTLGLDEIKTKINDEFSLTSYAKTIITNAMGE